MGNPEPTPFSKVKKKNTYSESKNKKKDRCRDSKEAVLTNGVDCAGLFEINDTSNLFCISIFRIFRYFLFLDNIEYEIF